MFLCNVLLLAVDLQLIRDLRRFAVFRHTADPLILAHDAKVIFQTKNYTVH